MSDVVCEYRNEHWGFVTCMKDGKAVLFNDCVRCLNEEVVEIEEDLTERRIKIRK